MGSGAVIVSDAEVFDIATIGYNADSMSIRAVKKYLMDQQRPDATILSCPSPDEVLNAVLSKRARLGFLCDLHPEHRQITLGPSGDCLNRICSYMEDHAGFAFIVRKGFDGPIRTYVYTSLVELLLHHPQMTRLVSSGPVRMSSSGLIVDRVHTLEQALERLNVEEGEVDRSASDPALQLRKKDDAAFVHREQADEDLHRIVWETGPRQLVWSVFTKKQ